VGTSLGRRRQNRSADKGNTALSLNRSADKGNTALSLNRSADKGNTALSLQYLGIIKNKFVISICSM
jgi:hypothetical protein